MLSPDTEAELQMGLEITLIFSVILTPLLNWRVLYNFVNTNFILIYNPICVQVAGGENG